MAKYLILACDGGGIRGYITTRVIQALVGDPRVGNFLPQVSLHAGTSTGSFIALALAAGRDVGAIQALYEQPSARQIFTPNPAIGEPSEDDGPIRGLLAKIDGPWKPLAEHLHDLVAVQYTNTGVMNAARSLLGETTTLSQLAPVVVNTLQLDDTTVVPDTWSPLVLSNLGGSPFAQMYAWEAGLCSGAAPIYFPPYRPASAPVGYCADGGLFANNPSLSAISSAIAAGARLEDIHLLSFDTGTTTGAMPASIIAEWGGPLHMGPVQWLSPATKRAGDDSTPKFPLLSALTASSAAAIALNARTLLGARYHRVTVPLTAPVPLDDTSDAAYATMDAALARFHDSPAYAAVTAWLASNFPAG